MSERTNKVFVNFLARRFAILRRMSSNENNTNAHTTRPLTPTKTTLPFPSFQQISNPLYNPGPPYLHANQSATMPLPTSVGIPHQRPSIAPHPPPTLPPMVSFHQAPHMSQPYAPQPHPGPPSHVHPFPAPPSAVQSAVDEASNSSAFRPLNVKDALSYLDQVKMQFGDQPEIYNRFLEVMKDFKSQA